MTSATETDRPAPGAARRSARTLALAAGAVGIALTCQLALALLLGGGAPQPSPEGIPDPGSLTGWAIPFLRLASDLLAVAAVAALAVPLLTAATPQATITGRARRPLRIARYALGGWLLTTLATAWFTTSDLLAVPPGSLSRSAVLSFLTDLDPGRAVLAEAALVTAALGRAAWSLRAREVGWSLALAAAAVLPRIITGHSAQSGSHDLAIVALALHVLAAMAWLGGTIAVAWLLRTAPASRERALRRFGPIAGAGLAVTVLAGLVSLAVRLTSPADLVTTSYGREALVKVALVLAIGLTAQRARARLASAAETAITAARWLLGVEIAVMLAAFAQGVALSRTPTPVGEPYTSVAESLLGGPMPSPPDAVALLTGFQPSGIALVLVGFGASGYIAGLIRLRRQQVAWPVGRSIAWFSGIAIGAYATSGGLAVYSHVMFSAHMAAHMLLSMVAPALLVLGAPITLALRALPGAGAGEETGARQLLMAVVNSRLLRLLGNPIVATALFVGSLYAIYFSPAFGWLMERHLGHAWMEAHFLIVGFLFFDVLIGVDPLPGRPPHLGRLGIMLVAMPFHAFFSIAVMASDTVFGESYYRLLQRPFATDLLQDQYVGGSLAWAFGEVPMLIVGVALFAQWRASDRREARRHDRNEDRDPSNSDLAAYNEMLRRRAEAMQRHAD